MDGKRLTAAAFILLTALYLRIFMPEFAAVLGPAVRDMLAREQVSLTIPEPMAVWLRSD